MPSLAVFPSEPPLFFAIGAAIFLLLADMQVLVSHASTLFAESEPLDCAVRTLSSGLGSEKASVTDEVKFI